MSLRTLKGFAYGSPTCATTADGNKSDTAEVIDLAHVEEGAHKYRISESSVKSDKNNEQLLAQYVYVVTRLQTEQYTEDLQRTLGAYNNVKDANEAARRCLREEENYEDLEFDDYKEDFDSDDCVQVTAEAGESVPVMIKASVEKVRLESRTVARPKSEARNCVCRGKFAHDIRRYRVR